MSLAAVEAAPAAPAQLSHPHWGAGWTGRCCTSQAAVWSGGTSSESAELNTADLSMQPCARSHCQGSCSPTLRRDLNVKLFFGLFSAGLFSSSVFPPRISVCRMYP